MDRETPSASEPLGSADENSSCASAQIVNAMEFNLEEPKSLVELHFVLVELQTGLTMSKIALSTRDLIKRNRTRAHARKAYDAVLRFMPRLDPDSAQARQIDSGLEELRWQLHLLGEQL